MSVNYCLSVTAGYGKERGDCSFNFYLTKQRIQLETEHSSRRMQVNTGKPEHTN